MRQNNEVRKSKFELILSLRPGSRWEGLSSIEGHKDKRNT